MKYATASALRAALDHRLVREAESTRTDIARLRRRIVFERLLVRFASDSEHGWILKGGAAVEVRLADKARMTRDLDLALRHSAPTDGIVRELLAEALSIDPQGDLFEFRVDRFRVMSIDDSLGPVWRASVDCVLDGRSFDRVSIDLVARMSETRRVEMLQLPGTLAFAGLEPVSIMAVDLNQHFAEKLHALLRTHGERPNTRVKDLADLVLFIEGGLAPSGALVAAVSDVFGSRGAGVPTAISDPPIQWNDRYSEMAADLDLSARSVDSAMRDPREFWSRALIAHDSGGA